MRENTQACESAETKQGEDEEEEVHVRRAQRNAKGKGKARATDEDADADDQVEEIIPDADEEKRFEEEHEDKVRALVLGKKPTQGVSLVNFSYELVENWSALKSNAPMLTVVSIFVNRVLQKWVSSSRWRCTSLCATNT